jgi:hypothetical protein
LEEITDGSVALLLVLNLMVELGQSGALIPEQLNEVIARALDLVGATPAQAHLRRRLQVFRRGWNPGRPGALSAKSRRRATRSPKVARREATN